MEWGNRNYYNGSFIFPGSKLDSNNVSKLDEDRYEVYVNENFVGHKTLKNEGEKLSDVDDFLRNQGMNEFSASLNGDHYLIQTNEEDAKDLESALSVYFNNR